MSEGWLNENVTVAGVELGVHRTGGGKPPIILVHGITDSGLCWTRVARSLERDWDVVMVDARGHGQSAHPGSYSFAEHVRPAAVDDILAGYIWLAARAGGRDTAVVADSSGAGLVMSMLQRLKQTGGPMPGRVVLLCPWVDLTCSFGDATEADPVSLMVRDQIVLSVPAYLAGHPLDDPDVNPLGADLTGLPTMLVQVGTGDFVLRDSRELVARGRQHGVDARLELYAANTHVFHLFWSFLPEAAKALERIGAFLTDETITQITPAPARSEVTDVARSR